MEKINIEFTLNELIALGLSASFQLLELQKVIGNTESFSRDLACLTYKHLSSSYDKIKLNIPDE